MKEKSYEICIYLYILYLSLNPGNNKAILTFLEKYIQPDKNGKNIIPSMVCYKKDNDIFYDYFFEIANKDLIYCINNNIYY